MSVRTVLLMMHRVTRITDLSRLCGYAQDSRNVDPITSLEPAALGLVRNLPGRFLSAEREVRARISLGSIG